MRAREPSLRDALAGLAAHGRPRRARRRPGGRRLPTPEYEATFNDGGGSGRRSPRRGGRSDARRLRRRPGQPPDREVRLRRELPLHVRGRCERNDRRQQVPGEPERFLRPGQQSSPTFPTSRTPRDRRRQLRQSLEGRRLRRRRNRRRRARIVSKFDSAGQLVPAWGTAGTMTIPNFDKMTVSPFTGDVWILDDYGTTRDRRAESPPTTPPATVASSTNRGSKPAATAISPSTRTTTSGSPTRTGFRSTPTSAQFPSTEQSRARRASTPRRRRAGPRTRPTATCSRPQRRSGTSSNESCEPTKGYCTPKESFGGGPACRLPKALAVDGTDYSVYVAVEGGIAVFRSKVDPGHHTQTGHRRPARTRCSPRISIRSAPGTSRLRSRIRADQVLRVDGACDQALPLTQAGDATVHLSGPRTRRRPTTTGSGRPTATARPTVPISPSPRTGWQGSKPAMRRTSGRGRRPFMENSIPPANRPTTTSNGARQNPTASKTPAPPGAVTLGRRPLTQVEASLAGLLTSSTTYHYRLVAVNSLGTSFGVGSRIHHAASPIRPQIRNVVATPTGLSTAVLSAELNPGFGDIAYRFQYGSGTHIRAQHRDHRPDRRRRHVPSRLGGDLGPRTGHHLPLPRHRVQLRRLRDQRGPGLHDADVPRWAHGNGDRCPQRRLSRQGSPGRRRSTSSTGRAPATARRRPPVGPDGLGSVIVTGLTSVRLAHSRQVRQRRSRQRRATGAIGQAQAGLVRRNGKMTQKAGNGERKR